MQKYKKLSRVLNLLSQLTLFPKHKPKYLCGAELESNQNTKLTLVWC